LDVERHRRATRSHNAEIRDHPLGAILRDDGHAISSAEVVTHQSGCQLFNLFDELLVRALPIRILLLDLHRNPLGRAARDGEDGFWDGARKITGCVHTDRPPQATCRASRTTDRAQAAP